MAYTSDYELAALAEPVNRAFAAAHGYEFIHRVSAPYDGREPERRQPMWEKVSLLLELLRSLLRRGTGTALPCAPDTTHLLWVDADAVVLRHGVGVEKLWRGLPPSIELLIGEDVTPTCLLNTGVMCVRVSEWSLALWEDVWSSAASTRFHRRQYHEQSALIRQLAARGEGLDAEGGAEAEGEAPPPFHSYLGGGRSPKLFRHVCVMPRHMLNTNRGDTRAVAAADSALDSARHELGDARCDFVFHAAGQPVIVRDGEGGVLNMAKSGKEAAIRTMLRHVGLAQLVAHVPERTGAGLAKGKVPAVRYEGEYGTLFRRYAMMRSIRGGGV